MRIGEGSEVSCAWRRWFSHCANLSFRFHKFVVAKLVAHASLYGRPLGRRALDWCRILTRRHRAHAPSYKGSGFRTSSLSVQIEFLRSKALFLSSRTRGFAVWTPLLGLRVHLVWSSLSVFRRRSAEPPMDTLRVGKLSLICLFGGRKYNQFDLLSSFLELITELSMGSREEEEGNVFHGRSGCGRTRG